MELNSLPSKPKHISNVRKSKCSDFQTLLLEEFLGGCGGGRNENGEAYLLNCNSDTSDSNKNECGITIPLETAEDSTNGTVDYKVEETFCDGTALNSVDITVTNIKIKSQLNKVPIIKLERLPRWVLEKKTVRISNDKIRYSKEDEYLSNSSEDEEENGNAIAFYKPPLFNFLVDPLMFSHHNNRISALYSNPKRCQRAASFFLHLNRYKPEEEPCVRVSPVNMFLPPTLQKLTTVRISSAKAHSCRQKSVKQKLLPTISNQKKQQTKDTFLTALLHKRKYYRQKRRDSEKVCWRCEYCDKTFRYKWNLGTHLMLHTGEKPYPCRLCDNRFQNRTQLIKHYSGQHPYLNNSDDTGDKQQQENELSGKLGSPQSDKVILNPSFSCGFCGDRFGKGKSLLEKHILEEHKDKLVRKVQKRPVVNS